MARLTAAQRRYLAEIRAEGRKVYNGRARKSIKALEAAGLVSVRWDMRPHVKGNGIELLWHITVTPVERDEGPPFPGVS